MSTEHRIATIDIGTNTVLLLVASWKEGTLVPIYQEQQFARLGEGVNNTGRLKPEAIQRVVRVLQRYKKKANQLKARVVSVAATSAARDAANQHELIEQVHAHTGWSVDILSGEEEAYWSFVGTLSMVPAMRQKPVTVLDIGGGSTEVISGVFDGLGRTSIHHAISLNVGAVRLTEQFSLVCPPSSEVLKAVEHEIVRQLFLELKGLSTKYLVGAAGTITALAMLVLNLSDPQAISLDFELPISTVYHWQKRLSMLSEEEILALNPEAMRGRSDVFLTGVLILKHVMEIGAFATCRVSSGGLRHGLVYRYMENKRQ